MAAQMLVRMVLLMSVVSAVNGLSKVCFKILGCFSEESPFSGTAARPIGHLPWPPNKINTRFLLYTKDNPDNFQEVSAANIKTITASNFRKWRKTRFVIHGYIAQGEGGWPAEMCQTIVKVEDVNCICVDWSQGAVTLYSQAANNIRVVGAEMAYFINVLQDTFGYDLSQVHLIGHSLGAHAAGEAGKRRPGIGRITGLDPAGPFFQDTIAEVRLDPSDALLVDAIHTDATEHVIIFGLGMWQAVGHLDFFPNGGKQMPGCSKMEILKNFKTSKVWEMTNNLAACNHIRSYKYYMESITTPDGFIGYRASTYEDFQAGVGFPCERAGCPLMGHYADRYSGVTKNTQRFFLNTGDAKNFARWRYKATVRISGKRTFPGSFSISLQGANGTTQTYNIHGGMISPGSLYAAFIDAEVDVGQVSSVTFIWYDSILSIFPVALGASTVSVLYGKDGSIYRFCDSRTTRAGVPLVLSPCS